MIKFVQTDDLDNFIRVLSGNDFQLDGEVLFTAIEFCASRVFSHLCNIGTNLNCGIKSTIYEREMPFLHYYLRGRRFQQMAFLIVNGVNLNLRDQYGRTVLQLVKDRKIFESLLQAGADVSLQNHDGNTPLHLVTEGRRARMLLDFGADPEMKNHACLTPLELAQKNL